VGKRLCQRWRIAHAGQYAIPLHARPTGRRHTGIHSHESTLRVSSASGRNGSLSSLFTAPPNPQMQPTNAGGPALR
jgi:hypothetical protein